MKVNNLDDKKFDIIITSNALQYIEDFIGKDDDSIKKLKEVFYKLKDQLNEEGILQLLYHYTLPENLKFDKNEVYKTRNIAEVAREFYKENLELWKFRDVIDKNYDGVVVYTKKGDNNMDDIIVIVGPTGIGKTKLSIELAKKLDGEIINGDSVSIYKKLDIGSAKPTIEERNGINHHLLDIKEVTEEYTVFDYQRDLRKKIEEINNKGKRIIIVGGTGLYIKAALYDYNFTEGTTYNEYNDLTNEEIYNKLKEYDVELPDLNNRKRLVRLLNKVENNEEITNNKDKLLYPIKTIGLTTPRETLYERINKRVDIMLKNGLLEEINGLKEYYNNSRILNSGIGYKEFYDYLFNNKDLNTVIEEIKQNSRRFAKRQYTFFKHQFETTWFDVDLNHFKNTVEEVYNYIKGESYE